MRERQFRQRKNPDSSTTALWQSYHQSSVTKQEKWAKGMRICPCKVFYSYFQPIFLPALQFYGMGLPAYFPSEGSCAEDFYCP
jgi:hypothetical protein